MKNSTDWNDYAKRTLPKFLSSLGADEINEVEMCKVDVRKLTEGSQQDAYDALRKCISDKSLRRYQNRYRQHKHREQNAISNLQLKESSLRRLKAFQEKISADSLDEAIDFLLSPEYVDYKMEVDEIKNLMAKENFDHQSAYFKNLIRWLPKYQLGRLRLIVENVFLQGWRESKQNKKRTGNPEKAALEKNEIIREIATHLNGKLDSDV